MSTNCIIPIRWCHQWTERAVDASCSVAPRRSGDHRDRAPDVGWGLQQDDVIRADMGASINGGTPGTPKSSNLIGFSVINHQIWGIPIYGNPNIFRLLSTSMVFRTSVRHFLVQSEKNVIPTPFPWPIKKIQKMLTFSLDIASEGKKKDRPTASPSARQLPDTSSLQATLLRKRSWSQAKYHPCIPEMAGDVRGESFPNHLHHEKLMNPTWKTPTLRWRARDPWNPGLKMKIQLVAMDVWMFIHSCGKITSRFWPIPSISCTSGLLGFDHGPSHSVSATETRWFSGQYMPSRPFRSFLVIGQSVWHSTW